jgi:hypothetical protein
MNPESSSFDDLGRIAREGDGKRQEARGREGKGELTWGGGGGQQMSEQGTKQSKKKGAKEEGVGGR